MKKHLADNPALIAVFGGLFWHYWSIPDPPPVRHRMDQLKAPPGPEITPYKPKR
jgi:predicted permease